MTLRRTALAGLTVAILAWPLAAPAAADAPQRWAWWNAVSGPGVVAPQPTTADGDLHVAQGPGEPLAYAALLYTNPAADTVRLVLALREDRVYGTPAVVACPTATLDWKPGPNQARDDGPVYHCDHPAQGALTEDGAAMVFALDERQQTTAGTWSIALVPQVGSRTPFSLDFAKPGQDAFTPATAARSEPEAPPTDDAVGVGPAAPPTFGSSFDSAPPADPPPAEAPAVEGPETIAPAPVPTAAPAGGPPAATRHVTSGERVLALLTLFAGTAFIGHSMQQERHTPHLLGGRARTLTVPLPDADLHPARHERPRGVGRFARMRHEPPRSLR